MTLNNMVEIVRQLHPQVGRTQVIFDLNKAMRQYAKETRILYGKALLTRGTDLISEDTTLFKSQWQLPEEVYEVWHIDQLYKEDFYLDENILNVRFVNKNIQNMEVDYFRYPMPITLNDDVPEFAEEFQDAPVAKVMEQYFMRNAQVATQTNTSYLPAAQYWGSVYKERVRDGKRHSNTRNRRNENPSIGGVKVITTFKSGLSLDQGVNTIPMTKTFRPAKDFAVTLNGNGIQVTEYSSSDTDPHADRTQTSFKVFAADPIINAFDYIVVGS